MHLYLMRHGYAEPGGLHRPDAERALTPDGVLLLQQQGLAFARMGLQPDRLLCSPLVRARQTAEIVGAALGVRPVVAEPLRCGCSFPDLTEVLHAHREAARILVVAHQPDLSYHLHTLTGAMAEVRPGTLAAVLVQGRLRPQNGRLQGLYPPEEMGALGEQGG